MHLSNEVISLKPIQQMLMDDDQLSAAELRELLIRHVRSNPFDHRNAPISEALVRAWTAACQRDAGSSPALMSGQAAYDLMKACFSSAFNEVVGKGEIFADDMWVWPVSLVNPTRSDIQYPRELLVAIGTAIGHEVGASIREARGVPHSPRN